MGSVPKKTPALAELVAAVPSQDFEKLLRAYVSKPGRIRNIGGFYWKSIKRREAVLSIWAGEISQYRLRRSSLAILNVPDVFEEMQIAVSQCADGTREVEVIRPGQDDPRRPVIQKLGIRERLRVVSRDGDTALLTFYLRSEQDGPVTPGQFEEYRDILQVAHELIALRHKIVGSEAFHFSPGTSIASLKERSVAPFGSLSDREVQICDLIVLGHSAVGSALELGIAVTTVRTLRQRAYRKLGISSTTQLLALVINDQQK